MKILAATVDWNDKFDNSPQLIIQVEQLHEDEEFRYASKPLIGGSTLYRAGHDGFVRFYLHNPHDEQGFGGRVFKLEGHYGETFKIKGPWSTRSGVINQHFMPHCTEAILTTSDLNDRALVSAYSSAVTLKVAIEAIKMTGNWFVRIVSGPNGETTYEPIMRRSLPKGLMSHIANGPINYAWEYVHPDVWSAQGLEHLRHSILEVGYLPVKTQAVATNPITEDAADAQKAY